MVMINRSILRDSVADVAPRGSAPRGAASARRIEPEPFPWLSGRPCGNPLTVILLSMADASASASAGLPGKQHSRTRPKAPKGAEHLRSPSAEPPASAAGAAAPPKRQFYCTGCTILREDYDKTEPADRKECESGGAHTWQVLPTPEPTPTKEKTKRDGKKRARGKTTDSSESDSDDSDIPDALFPPFEYFKDKDLPEKIVCTHPVQPHRVARAVASGDKTCYLGDATRFPPTRSLNMGLPIAVDDPIATAFNEATCNDMLVVRDLGSILSQLPAAKRSMRGEEDDPKLSEMFVGGAEDFKVSMVARVEDAFCRAALAIGTRANAVRDARTLAAAAADNDKIPDARSGRGPSAVADVPTFTAREKAEDSVGDIDQLGVDVNTTMLTIEKIHHNKNFVTGVCLTDLMFDTERSTRALWRSATAYDSEVYNRVRKLYRTDIKKAQRSATERKEQAKLAAVAAAAAGKVGATHGDATASGAGAAVKGDGKGGAGGHQGGGRPNQNDKDKLMPRRTKAQVLAAPPANRSNTEVRRFGLCVKCREEGHKASDCKKDDAVAYSGHR